MVMLLISEVPDYKSVMLIHSYIQYVYIYICIISYDTGPRFEPIFMKLTQLMRVHSWLYPIVFGNNRPNSTTDMGENVPQKQFFGFKSDGMGFFKKKNLKTIWYPIP